MCFLIYHKDMDNYFYLVDYDPHWNAVKFTSRNEAY